MDKASVAHLFGTCFAEALRERVGDNGSVGSGKIAAELGSEHHIPAEFVERMTGYAARIGAVDAVKLADESTAFYYTDDYQQTTRRTLAIDAGRAEDRGDYAVSYAPADTRVSKLRTPAVLFPEATKDTVTAGEAEAAPKSTRTGQDECERWYQQAISRRQINAQIIATSPAPQRKDYTADPLAAYRERVEAQAGDEARENYAKAEARRKWREADRLINWLYHRPGQAQEINSLYYERGAHSPEAQERISAALNRLKDLKKVYRSRRGGKVYARLAEGVKPRRYTRRELEGYEEVQTQEIADETAGNEEDTGPEQSFDPQVMAEMAATGASYTEAWDS
ncbi:hypothetical protein [Rubrobacter aplysinae]|uniref:hypothetical protein n=1 Tax=Rubrobacter aplysinae TaxID=909625 RepID=UPI00064C04A8|nr:hypothetical protein [Rubrobacter aplysinae]